MTGKKEKTRKIKSPKYIPGVTNSSLKEISEPIYFKGNFRQKTRRKTVLSIWHLFTPLKLRMITDCTTWLVMLGNGLKTGSRHVIQEVNPQLNFFLKIRGNWTLLMCLSVCLFVYLFVCLYVCMSVCLSNLRTANWKKLVRQQENSASC